MYMWEKMFLQTCWGWWVRKVVRTDQLHYWRSHTIWLCISRFSSEKIKAAWKGKLGPRHAVKFPKGAWHQIKIRERKGSIARNYPKVWFSWAWSLRVQLRETILSGDCAPRKMRQRNIMGASGNMWHSEPTDVDAVNSLLSGKGKASSSNERDVSSAAVLIFNETTLHAMATASNRLAKGKQSKWWFRNEGERKTGEDKGKSEGKIQRCQRSQKVRTQVRARELISQALNTRNQRQIPKLRNLHRRIPTDHFHTDDSWWDDNRSYVQRNDN